jgi:hypothetical protein
MNPERVYMLSRVNRRVEEYIVRGRPKEGRIILEKVLPFELSADGPPVDPPFETRDNPLLIYSSKADALRENVKRLQATIVYYSDVLAKLNSEYDNQRNELAKL